MQQGRNMALLILLLISMISVTWGQNYVIGVGIADVTGPAAGINMMGYANPAQSTGGIHTRLYSRAFIIANEEGLNPLVFVSVDIGMISTLIRHEVTEKIADNRALWSLYNEDNVMISATHTHSGPAAYHQYFLYEVTSLGFSEESLDAIVDGIVKSIENAHFNMQPGDLYLNSGDLEGASINRSPYSYNANPADERARYNTNVDQEMVLLKFEGAGGKDLGMINWFAVHPVSMNNTNELISSDNKGYAELRFEADFNDGLPGKGPFVGAFAQSNQGDVSPNIDGAKCIDTGDPCDELTNACSDGRVTNCIASGPGDDMFESTRIIGGRQYQKAKELYNEASQKLQGPPKYKLKYVDMTNQEVVVNSSYTATTCKPALGYSFAAGTSDGPGALNFTQGDLTGDPFWDSIRDLLREPSEELLACHEPKPILLATGEMTIPHMWQPEILDYQIFSIGQLAIVGVPGEYTTMAGRRIREMVHKVLTDNGFPEDTVVVLGGLTNAYSGYITTYEEYLVQRYEGGSTLYGPHTLQAAMNTFEELALALATDQSVEKGTPPPNLKNEQISLIPLHLFDEAPFGKAFGDVWSGPSVNETFRQGDQVAVKFVAASPRTDLRTDNTYLTVERMTEDEEWEIIRNDGNWDTRFYWEGEGLIGTRSNVTVAWDIPADFPSGTFRIQHFGYSKNLLGLKTFYTGTSNTFKVEPPSRSTYRSSAGRFKRFLRSVFDMKL